MNKEKLASVGIDYTNAIRRFAGKEDIYDKYLVKFKSDTHMELAEKAFEEQDYSGVLNEIHTLKGVVGTLGMDALYEACSEVVAAIRANNMEHLDVLLQKVETEQKKVMSIL